MKVLFNRRFVIVAMTIMLCLAMLAGCGNSGQKEESGPSEIALEALDAAVAEREDYEDGLRSVDVLEGKVLKQDENYLLRFPNAPTEYLSDVLVYVDSGAEDRLPAYLFIAHIKDNTQLSKIQSVLIDELMTLPGMDSEDIEINMVSEYGYILAAAAVNASDITNKYVVTANTESPDSSSDLYALLATVEKT